MSERTTQNYQALWRGTNALSAEHTVPYPTKRILLASPQRYRSVERNVGRRDSLGLAREPRAKWPRYWTTWPLLLPTPRIRGTALAPGIVISDTDSTTLTPQMNRKPE